MYLKVGELNNCIKDLSVALQINPENLKIYYQLGLAFYKSEDYVQSIHYLEEAIEKGLNKNKNNAYYYLGRILIRIGFFTT